MEPPTPHHVSWLIKEIEKIPVNFMTAAVKGTGKEINWYGDKEMTIDLGKIVLLLTQIEMLYRRRWKQQDIQI